MGEKTKTPITQQEWRNLHPGNGIKDANGHLWTVTAGDFIGGNPDVLFAYRSGHGEEELKWEEGQIIFDDRIIAEEFNHPSVEIVA